MFESKLSSRAKIPRSRAENMAFLGDTQGVILGASPVTRSVVLRGQVGGDLIAGVKGGHIVKQPRMTGFARSHGGITIFL